jgi:hypothetical protein
MYCFAFSDIDCAGKMFALAVAHLCWYINSCLVLIPTEIVYLPGNSKLVGGACFKIGLMVLMYSFYLVSSCRKNQ